MELVDEMYLKNSDHCLSLIPASIYDTVSSRERLKLSKSLQLTVF